MVLPDGRVESCGNFHGAPVALRLRLPRDRRRRGRRDLASGAPTACSTPTRSQGLPPFLAPDAGVDSGLMIAQYTQAAMVAENRRLAAPASVDSLPTSAMQEDHVSMGWGAARKLRTVVANLRRILAVELTCAGPRRSSCARRSSRPAAPARRWRRCARWSPAPAPTAGSRRSSPRSRSCSRGGALLGRGRGRDRGAGVTPARTPTLIDEAFRRDGAVPIRGLLSAAQVETLRRGIDRNRAEPGPLAQGHGAEQTFFEDFCNWERIDEYETVIRDAGPRRARPPS